MKKITTIKFLITLMIMGVNVAFAQYPFKFLKVDYVGAMDQNDWTKGWANFNPQQTDYPSVNETTTLNAAATGSGKIEITGNVSLDSNKVYLLTGIVYVRTGATLTIPAGTIIRSEGDATATPANWSVIVIQRGGKIISRGSKNAPVVFTSNKAKGSRKPGDWGGIILLGKATNNQPGGQTGCTQCLKGESLIEGPFGYPDGVHGGNDDADNSGTLLYTRVEFPGLVFSANNEINGITLGSVGDKTFMRYLQVSYSNDDSYEWFGGTVNSRYIIAFKGTDDDFDTDFGYRGMNQFGIGFKDSTRYDPTWNASGGSTSEGFESDNDGTGTIARPKTAAIFCNFTMVGPYAEGETFSQHSATVKGAFRRGARIRRNSTQSILNSIFMGYRNGIMLDGAATEGNANVASGPDATDSLMIRNTIFMGLTASPTATATGLVEVATGRDTGLVAKWLRTSSNRINPVAWAKNTLLVDPNNYTNPDFRPIASSIALTGADFTNSKLVGLTEASVRKSIKNGSIQVYPNPSSGIANVELNLVNQANLTISILTMDGKLIKSLNDSYVSGRSVVTFEGLSQGVYIVRVSENVSFNTFKLIVK